LNATPRAFGVDLGTVETIVLSHRHWDRSIDEKA
jgi:metal-dependent hydrolase (beta-lactamase superfamily II)